MNSRIWKQTDSRWAKKPYPSGSTVGGCGCGLLACTHVAMEQERYKNWTPENLRPWMLKQGFALRGQGTKWEGITQTLKYIGHSTVVRIYNDPMSEAWKELNKGNRIGVLLFNGNKAPNGVRWTASGHYVAFTGYKVQDGKHYFYTKDSGGRNHDGWYTYENSMKGCIAKLWIVQRVGAQATATSTSTTKAATVSASTYKPKTAYKGSLPSGTVKSGSKGNDAKAVQTFLNWCINAKLGVDGIIGAKSVSAIKTFQKTYGLTVDGVFGPASKKKAQSIINAHKPKTTAAAATVQDKVCDWAKKIANDNSYVYVAQTKSDSPANHCCTCKGIKSGKYHGWNCIRFVGAAYYHGGGVKVKSADHKLVTTDMANSMLRANSANALKIWQDRNGSGWQIVRNSNKKIPESMLKKGDVLVCYNKEGSSATYKHMALYQGGGMITDASSNTGISTRKYSSLGVKCLIAVRYTK